jgi:phosphopantetheinyl transferase (holo-ACP synthase)
MSIELRLSCSRITLAEASGAREVCSPLERAYSGADQARGLAGRVAAKHAVARMLGTDPSEPGLLKQIQIVPGRRLECHDPALCERGHPPTVRFEPGCGLAESNGLVWIDVSVSHDREQAFAAALGVFVQVARDDIRGD